MAYSFDMKSEAPFLCLNLKGRQSIQLHPKVQPKEVIEALGQPTKSWDDGTDHTLRYCTADLELELLWGVEHELGMKRLRFRYADLEFTRD